MTTVSEAAPGGARNHAHERIWRRSTHALGKLWAKLIASLETPSAAARREVPPEVWRFPPF